MSFSVPALDSAGRRLELGGHRADAAELLEDAELVHDMSYNRTCNVRQSHFTVRGENRTATSMEPSNIVAALKRLGVPHEAISSAINRDRTSATKMLAGTRKVQADEIPALVKLIGEYEHDTGEEMLEPVARDYLPIEILPSYAGMGGGGTGDGDRATALISRALVEDVLRARANDLLVIDARGDSMQPDFMHGDQILIDRRDNNPVQPGPFALWDGDGYVVKLVERIPNKRGWYKVSSANARYDSYEVNAEEIQIMGRPVWFGRRL